MSESTEIECPSQPRSRARVGRDHVLSQLDAHDHMVHPMLSFLALIVMAGPPAVYLPSSVWSLPPQRSPLLLGSKPQLLMIMVKMSEPSRLVV